MIYFHGSPIKGILTLEPQLSQHEKPYAYLTTSEVLAALYTVNRIWYSYGFNEDKTIPIYDEWYPNALQDIYSGKVGYIYGCEDVDNLSNPTKIPMVFVSEKTIKPISYTEITDVYEKLMEYENKGLLIIRPYNTLSEKLKDWYKGRAEEEIASNSHTANFLKNGLNSIRLFKKY